MRGFWIVTTVTVILFAVALVWANNDPHAPFLILVFLSGSLGALIREHLEVRRLIRSSAEDLDSHLPVVLFSPITGGVLAVVAALLLASGFIGGRLFPDFVGMDHPFTNMRDLQRGLGLRTQADAVKLLIWGIVAGLSERFVVERLHQLAAGRPRPRSRMR